MHIKTVAAIAAAITSVNAGTANIYNFCSFEAYVWPTDDVRNPSEPTVIPPGGSYSEPFHTPASGGVSLKVGKSKTMIPDEIDQFEYTPAGPTVFYDGSHVNCVGTKCPFEAYGAYIDTSDASCPTRSCIAGAGSCPGWYQLFNDDWNTLSCAVTATLNMYLCSSSNAPPAGGAPSGAPSGTTGGAAPPPPPAAAVPSPSAPAKHSEPARIAMERVHGPSTLVPVVVPTKRAVHAHARRHGH